MMTGLFFSLHGNIPTGLCAFIWILIEFKGGPAKNSSVDHREMPTGTRLTLLTMVLEPC